MNQSPRLAAVKRVPELRRLADDEESSTVSAQCGSTHAREGVEPEETESLFDEQERQRLADHAAKEPTDVSDSNEDDTPLFIEPLLPLNKAEVDQEATSTTSPPSSATDEASSPHRLLPPPERALGGSDGEEPQDSGSQTMLVVDDSPTVRKLVSLTLEGQGYGVRTAENGVEAMKSLAEFTPNLILLDVKMPRMDGYKLCKMIKSHARTRAIPVVMLSGRDGVFDKLRGKMVGCDAYITKPFEPEDLLTCVRRNAVGSTTPAAV